MRRTQWDHDSRHDRLYTEAIGIGGAECHHTLHGWDGFSPRGRSPVPGHIDLLVRRYVPGLGVQPTWEPRPF